MRKRKEAEAAASAADGEQDEGRISGRAEDARIMELAQNILSNRKCEETDWFGIQNDCRRILSGTDEAVDGLQARLMDLDDPDARDYCRQLDARIKELGGEVKVSASTVPAQGLPPADSDKEAVEAPNGDVKAAPDNAPQVNAGAGIIMVPVGSLYAHPAIGKLYPPDKAVLEILTGEMARGGCDMRFPLLVLPQDKDGRYAVYDGLTRLAAKIKSKSEGPLPVIVKHFANDADMVAEAIRIQHLKRPCSDEVVLRSVKALADIAARQAKSHQGKRTDIPGTCGQPCPEVENANAYIAGLVCKSETTVKHAKKVLEDRKLAGKVLSGEMTINAAYEGIKEKKPDAGKPGSAGGTEAALAGPRPNKSDKKPVDNDAEEKTDPQVATGHGDAGSQDFPVPHDLLEALVVCYQAANPGKLDGMLGNCNPDTAKAIRKTLAGKKAA
ncbi:MAG TPA: hypothetical protein DCZ94_20090 [Lentisphaeria bacterium]|nr:MAG: hypothetical protein A2X48_14735 [Lentisphaerae bacterium GWF2_49_21]HBC89247.1 hypothetical protein [Lentisphaeria bacterium]